MNSPPASRLQLSDIPLLGYLAIGPAALFLGLLGLWIAFSGVGHVRGADLQVVFTLQKVLRGLPIYTDPAAVPFDIVQYGPVYYLVVTGFAKLLRIDPANAASLVALARGVSLLCALVLIAGFYRVSRQALRLSNRAALVSAGLVFILTSPWFFLARPDAMAVLAAMASLAVIADGQPPRTSRIVGSAALAVLAVFIKQNEIQILPVLALYLWLAHGWRQAALCTASAAAFGLLALGMCLIQWPFFLANVIDGVDNGISFSYFATKTLPNFLYPQATLVGLAGFAVLSWMNDRADARRLLFVVALPALFLFALATGLKIGSAENYFNEFSILALAAVALMLSPHSGDRGDAISGGVVTRLVCFAGVVLLVGLPLWTASQLQRYWWLTVNPSVSVLQSRDSLRGNRYRNLNRLIDRAVLSDDGYVLAAPLTVNIALNVPMLLPQKDVAQQSFQRGLIDYAEFQRLVATGRVRYLIIDALDAEEGGLNASFIGADLRGYVPAGTVAGFTVYVWSRR